MNTDKQQFHFYASSVATWMVDDDIHSLIARMDEEGFGYNLVWVPVPIESNYEIRMYSPVVDGCVWLGFKSSKEIEAQS